ncbi:DEAD/DEAH box helicase [Brachybacterium saurashtrense]|uniref:ATP-dependent helicase n=1 Tax=Brachybacterium saurashtrense TaxID=556288 RepID=A0A345YP97_9MICO|nr:DEAD/DEAH box helicase [Brachybacterium saurashtrense]AXK45749.1 ATP-dependent helicase [Brachybacterium saurashtrense]RRR24767.1 ATP-dependent helicase [Brachybacterium saurashtrense]
MPDPELLPRLLPSAISHHVGDRSAGRGLAAARAGRVSDLTWDAAAEVVSARVADETGVDAVPHRTEVELVEYAPDAVSLRFQAPGPGGLWRPRRSGCDCSAGESCLHVAATLYRLNELSTRAVEEAPPSEWRSVLRPLLGATPTRGGTAGGSTTAPKPLALRFDLEAGTSGSGASRHHRETATPAHVAAGAELWLGMRPLTRGRKGTWVKGDLSWRTFEYRQAGREYDAAHGEALTRLFAAASVERSYSSGAIEHLWLNAITSPLLWQSLEHARSAGVELLPGAGLAAIDLAAEGEVGLDLRADPATQDLAVRPRVRIGGQEAARGRVLGAAGVLDVQEAEDDALLTARVAPLNVSVPRALRGLLHRREPLVVPSAERSAFLEVAYPQLRGLTAITSEDDSIELPAARRPTLHLEAAYASGDRLALRWSWHYHDPDRRLPMDQRHGAHRDRAHEDAVIAEAMSLWPMDPTDAPELLSGTDTAHFTEHVLDDLAALDHVEVEITGTRHAYRELDGAPQVRVTQQAAPGKNDWFDLGFEITIEGRQIPFPSLFVALAQGSSRLLMPDRTYFSLDHPAFDALRELIREGEALAEWEPERQRISRFQLDLWDDLAEIAEETVAAEQWHRTAASLRTLEDAPAPSLPRGLDAALRPYQQEGFAWLATLFAHSLGGILADDMGLGKTVQTLALIARAREQEPQAPPFLVVAPASVVPVWRREAERFTPGLDVRVLEGTAASRGQDLASAMLGADIVVTSYAVLRLDEEQFAGRAVQGLVLDEAQFVKNRRSRTHRAAKGVLAPFRLAITGTPMENSLDDLWALMDLVSPGLLGTAIGFRKRYTLPVESGEHPERMALLRRRVRPFLLRRTKELVARELPEKQEEVLTVTLSPEHRAVYDSVLQRERKKVLGLIETDLDRSRFIVFRSLTLLRMMALDPALVDAEEYADVPSSKLAALFDRLEEVIGDGHRVLLFSQFTSYLDRVAAELDRREVRYAHLDGATRDRDAAVTGFREGGAPVFLISLKAGGFGLTLTEADYVFLLDPWWNPAAENQAVDRAHRIGQERQVMVYRMIAEDTIEEKVLALQRRKAELFDALTDGGEAFRAAVTAEDLRELLS